MSILKPVFLPLFAAVAITAAATLPVSDLHSQSPSGPDTSSSTTEDSTGKVTAINPNQTISVTSRRGPFTYRLGRDLHVVGPDGKHIKVEEVQVGQEVTVYYYLRDGQPTVARIAVLKDEEKKKE
jgi:hypothetical protein